MKKILIYTFTGVIFWSCNDSDPQLEQTKNKKKWRNHKIEDEGASGNVILKTKTKPTTIQKRTVGKTINKSKTNLKTNSRCNPPKTGFQSKSVEEINDPKPKSVIVTTNLVTTKQAIKPGIVNPKLKDSGNSQNKNGQKINFVNIKIIEDHDQARKILRKKVKKSEGIKTTAPNNAPPLHQSNIVLKRKKQKITPEESDDTEINTILSPIVNEEDLLPIIPNANQPNEAFIKQDEKKNENEGETINYNLEKENTPDSPGPGVTQEMLADAEANDYLNLVDTEINKIPKLESDNDTNESQNEVDFNIDVEENNQKGKINIQPENLENNEKENNKIEVKEVDETEVNDEDEDENENENENENKNEVDLNENELEALDIDDKDEEENEPQKEIENESIVLKLTHGFSTKSFNANRKFSKPSLFFKVEFQVNEDIDASEITLKYDIGGIKCNKKPLSAINLKNNSKKDREIGSLNGSSLKTLGISDISKFVIEFRLVLEKIPEEMKNKVLNIFLTSKSEKFNTSKAYFTLDLPEYEVNNS